MLYMASPLGLQILQCQFAQAHCLSRHIRLLSPACADAADLHGVTLLVAGVL